MPANQVWQPVAVVRPAVRVSRPNSLRSVRPRLASMIRWSPSGRFGRRLAALGKACVRIGRRAGRNLLDLPDGSIRIEQRPVGAAGGAAAAGQGGRAGPRPRGGEGGVKKVNPPPPTPPALVLRWESARNPLPLVPVRLPPGARPPAVGREAPPWLATGPAGRPFDFCGHVARLCADLVRRCPDLAHVDVSRLLFDVTQARSGTPHGLQARVTPLRFPGGVLTRRRAGTLYQAQRYLLDGRDMLYLVTFCLPRFLDQSFDDKVVT